ncbi:unnamed protein product, partial [Enterobius vermicularis]|uniref:C-type lectin domain-containing protein n=1 Tax=Enterobius vermicularis TaxID=51028 RepID=A0A0N4UT47_ENTVE
KSAKLYFNQTGRSRRQDDLLSAIQFKKNFWQQKLLFKEFWIGLEKQSNERWSWTDNSPFDFKQWGFMQPDNCCGTNVKWHWFDVSCGLTHGFLCKYNPLCRRYCAYQYRQVL